MRATNSKLLESSKLATLLTNCDSHLHVQRHVFHPLKSILFHSINILVLFLNLCHPTVLKQTVMV